MITILNALLFVRDNFVGRTMHIFSDSQNSISLILKLLLESCRMKELISSQSRLYDHQENADISRSTSFARLYRSAKPNYVLLPRVPRKLSSQTRTTLSRTSTAVSSFLFKMVFDCVCIMSRRVRLGLRNSRAPLALCSPRADFVVLLRRICCSGRH